MNEVLFSYVDICSRYEGSILQWNKIILEYVSAYTNK